MVLKKRSVTCTHVRVIKMKKWTWDHYRVIVKSWLTTRMCLLKPETTTAFFFCPDPWPCISLWLLYCFQVYKPSILHFDTGTSFALCVWRSGKGYVFTKMWERDTGLQAYVGRMWIHSLYGSISAPGVKVGSSIPCTTYQLIGRISEIIIYIASIFC